MTAPLLPRNATPLERALSLAVGQRLEAVPVPLRDLWSPDTCPVDFLPVLAATFSVAIWRDAWPEARKRHVVRVAAERHRIQGTPAAIRLSLADIGIDGARVIERLGNDHAAALHHDGAARYDGRKDYSGRTVAISRGNALFGVAVPPEAMDRIDELRQVIAVTKRAACHLAWIKPEQRLVDALPSPTDSQALIARTAVADQLLPGPRYDGAYTYGGAAVARHDAVIRYTGAVTYDGSPVVTAPAQIHYGRPLMADAVTIAVRRAISSPLDAPAHHDGALHYDGAAHHTGRRPALSDRLGLTAPGPALTAGPYPLADPPAQAITAGAIGAPPNPAPGITAGTF